MSSLEQKLKAPIVLAALAVSIVGGCSFNPASTPTNNGDNTRSDPTEVPSATPAPSKEDIWNPIPSQQASESKKADSSPALESDKAAEQLACDTIDVLASKEMKDFTKSVGNLGKEIVRDIGRTAQDIQKDFENDPEWQQGWDKIKEGVGIISEDAKKENPALKESIETIENFEKDLQDPQLREGLEDITEGLEIISKDASEEAQQNLDENIAQMQRVCREKGYD